MSIKKKIKDMFLLRQSSAHKIAKLTWELILIKKENWNRIYTSGGFG